MLCSVPAGSDGSWRLRHSSAISASAFFRIARSGELSSSSSGLSSSLLIIGILLWALTLPEAQEPEDIPPPLPAAVQAAVLSAAKPPENLLVCDITGYCACCTPYADINRNEAGQVLTASGRWVCIGEAVAVDPDIIPLGSTVTIGGKEYIAADTGVYGYTVDVLMTHEEAAQAGVVKAMVQWEW